jgi:ribonuclease Z
MHVADLVAHAHRFQNEAILLTHFSPRYTRADILAALEANMPPSLRAKCVPLLNGFV